MNILSLCVFSATRQLFKADINTEAAKVYYVSVCCLSIQTINQLVLRHDDFDEYKLPFLSLLLLA